MAAINFETWAKPNVWKVLLPSAVLLLQGCSDGSSGPEDDFPPGTYGLSGSVTGIAGEIEIDVNGTSQVISTNGEWQSEARVNENENYAVTLKQSNGMSCTIANASGNSDVNVSDVDIECDGQNQTAYNLNSLDFAVTEPSILTFAFHLIDRFSGSALNNLTADNITEYLDIKENDSPISPSESFLEVDKFENVNAEYTTVFAIDISGSMSNRELTNITDAIKETLVDSETGLSQLEPNQYVSILSFDGDVTEVLVDSQDTELLFEALDGLSIGGNSTNLYGAIQSAVNMWDNEISLQSIHYGNLILFTDGNDTSSIVSKSDALSAASGKDIYFIATGSETDTSVLKEFTSSNNIFTLDDFSALTSTLKLAYDHVKTFEDGLYLLSYASPKRAGTHELTITAIDDFNCDYGVTEDEQAELQSKSSLTGCSDNHTYDFNADNFSDVEAELTLSGSTVTLTPSVTWTAKLRWTRQQPNFEWNVKQCVGAIDSTVSEDGNQIEFTRTSEQMSLAQVWLTDTTTGITINDGEGQYLFMAPNEAGLLASKLYRPELICAD
jgi:uncharacterized protein YegL